MTRTRGTALACLFSVLGLVSVTGCGALVSPPAATNDVARAAGAPAAGTALAVPRPGALHAKLVTPDVVLWRSTTLTPALLKKVRAVPGVGVTEPFSLARVFSQDRAVTFAAVDPGTFRRFTLRSSARTQEIWNRVADGELALRATKRSTVPVDGDLVPLGGNTGHVGYYTDELVRGSGIDSIVNSAWAPMLGMPADNALLVSVADGSVDSATRALARIVGSSGVVAPLTANGAAAGMAVPTGGSVAAAVGSFMYTINSDGTVNPDPKWVSEYIRTEQVPILGNVTCNKAMIPQLRAALDEIVSSGLRAEIHAGEYGGCYVPRFIAKDQSRGLSMHTWGLAVDLNVPGNLRGTTGTMSPDVVQIFARWGFAWGGTWRDPDPMHFELAQLVEVDR